MENILQENALAGGQGKLSYRSGVAARLAGLSVETLRVWERRYGVCATERSEHGQRLYSADQVRRLGLLKALVDKGHPIGMLAALADQQLEAMAPGPAGVAQEAAGPIRVAVVGEGLARRIAAAGRDGMPLVVQKSCHWLDQVADVLGGVPVDVLLVEISEPDHHALAHLLDARSCVTAAAVVVLYRFCSSATIRSLRERGFLVARVPAEPGELVLLCRAALAGQVLAPLMRQADPVTPPRFDDAALAGLRVADGGVECECPHHLAEILMMIGSFERYSAQCATRSDRDAQLHRELGRASGQARVLLEAAMVLLIQADGLVLPTPAAPVTGKT